MRPFIIKNNNRGIAALPVILLISAIITEIVVAGAFVAFSFSSGSFGSALSNEALFGARAGAEDAIYRVITNTYQPSYSLVLTVGNHTVNNDIVIEKDPIDLGTCSVVNWGCRFRITSTGKVVFRQRKIQVILSVDPLTREIRRDSFKEIEI